MDLESEINFKQYFKAPLNLNLDWFISCCIYICNFFLCLLISINSIYIDKLSQIGFTSTSPRNEGIPSNVMKLFHMFIKTRYNMILIIINSTRRYTIFTGIIQSITNLCIKIIDIGFMTR